MNDTCNKCSSKPALCQTKTSAEALSKIRKINEMKLIKQKLYKKIRYACYLKNKTARLLLKKGYYDK